ncbi:MAG: ABC transporter ATP-binding protein, partial [Parvibaculaceae bacterium]
AENVAFPLRMRKAPRNVIEEKVQHALRLVKLPEYGARMPHELSGGQRQRVAFARAVVFEPKVLLMDEPLGALDLKLREHMQLEIKHYQAQIGCTVVYVTHDQSEALTLSDRIVIMNRGRIVQIGTPSQIYDLPQTRFAAEFVGETNILRVVPDGEGRGALQIAEMNLPFGAPGACPASGCLLSIRPEKLNRVRNGENPDHIVFEAVVRELAFLGDVIRYVAELPSGAALTLKEARTRSARPIELKEKVRLSFDPKDAVLIPHGD